MSEKKISKSKRIQEFLQANPAARNRDVVSELSEFGVTPADVSNAKAQMKKKYSRRRSRAAAAVVAADSSGEDANSSVDFREIDAAIDYVQSVGGIQRARQLLAVIQQIQEI